MIYCGIDWAEVHHDVALIDHSGTLVAKARIRDDAAGYRILLGLLAEHGDHPDDPIPIAIETPRGLLVATLRAGKRKVFAINPMAAARYRERYAATRRKSDHFDALVLANILRTDMHVHRPLPADTGPARAIATLARAQQEALQNRDQIANQLRSLLREYYPAALTVVAARQGGLCRAEARELFKAAPTPAQGARLTRTQLRAILKRAGRVRGVGAEVERLREILRADAARQPELIELAMGRQALALLRQLDAACIAADELAADVEHAFGQHPDAAILRSFPGLGVQLAARILAEIGDDRARFTNARALKAYAGAAPITRASGTSVSVRWRRVKNDRLNHAGYLWAFSSLRNSPGAYAHYRRRRETGDRHSAALRNLFNRMLGQLFHCLQTNTLYNEQHAFPTA